MIYPKRIHTLCSAFSSSPAFLTSHNMHKKLLTLLCSCLLILFTTYPAFSNDQSFQDTENHWAKNYIDQLHQHCNTKGYQQRTMSYFMPDQEITRAELAQILFQCREDRGVSPNEAPFADVQPDAWFAPAVSFAKEKGWVSGYNDKTFHPEQPVTRAEAMKIMLLSRYLIEDIVPVGKSSFNDVQDSAWFFRFVQFGYEQKLIDGYKDDTGRLIGRFGPEKTITRAEVAKIITLIYKWPNQENINNMNHNTNDSVINTNASNGNRNQAVPVNENTDTAVSNLNQNMMSSNENRNSNLNSNENSNTNMNTANMNTPNPLQGTNTQDVLFFEKLGNDFPHVQSVQSGTQVTYLASNSSGKFEIYRVSRDSRNSAVLQLTDNKFDDLNPDFTVNGQIVVFVSNRDGNYEIYRMNSDGSSPTRLTNNAYDDVNPSIDYAGNRIVFASNRSGNFEIYTMNLDGSGVVQLTNSEGDDIHPSFGPPMPGAATQIVFSSNREGNFEIYRMSDDKSSLIRLTNNSAHDLFPVYSGSTKILFVSDRGGEPQLYQMSPEGTGQSVQGY